MEGQINRGSAFGEVLYKVAAIPKVKKVVEIGTWNGMGSTKCIIDGLKESGKTDYYFQSFEANLEMFRSAYNNLMSIMVADHMCLYHGTLVKPDEFPVFDPTQMVKEWYDADVAACGSSTCWIENIPAIVDLLFIDGGEYTGYVEYSKLKDRSNIIALDDTKSYKCKQIRDELLIDENFQVMYDDFIARGTSVFVRKEWME